MALQILVSPAGDGWAVRSEAFDNDLLFEAGGRSEAAARALADRYARAGNPAEVSIYLRNGDMAGRFVHQPHAGSL